MTLTAFATALIDAAVNEKKWWDTAGCVEHQGACVGRVGKYWKILGLNLDGSDEKEPWSAAFICWCMSKASMPWIEFPFHVGHHAYIRWAIQNQKLNKPAKTFYGRKIGDYAPKPGDLIASWRQTPVRYDSIPNGSFASHCDIVITVEPTRIIAIGGNLSHKVREAKYPIGSNGKLKPEDHLIAVLECRK